MSTSRQLFAWFSSPWVGLLGTVFAIVGVGFAVFTYSNTQKTRKLEYYVSPVKAVILKSGQISGLRVYLNRTEVVSDVTDVQLAVWNAGRESIRSENILSNVLIVTHPHVAILDAKIRKRSRDVTEFAIDRSRFTDGVVQLSWKILENGDGALVELIYAGSPETSISVEGVIEGQSRIIPIAFPGKIQSGAEQLVAARNSDRTIAIVFGVLFPLALVVIVLDVKGRKRRPVRFSDLFMPLVSGGVLIYTLYRLWVSPAPPFGF